MLLAVGGRICLRCVVVDCGRGLRREIRHVQIDCSCDCVRCVIVRIFVCCEAGEAITQGVTTLHWSDRSLSEGITSVLSALGFLNPGLHLMQTLYTSDQRSESLSLNID